MPGEPWHRLGTGSCHFSFIVRIPCLEVENVIACAIPSLVPGSLGSFFSGVPKGRGANIAPERGNIRPARVQGFRPRTPGPMPGPTVSELLRGISFGYFSLGQQRKVPRAWGGAPSARAPSKIPLFSRGIFVYGNIKCCLCR